MPSGSSKSFDALLDEKLADSLVAPLPDLTPRRVAGPLRLPGKATAVVGMRRAGKTTFLHQLRRERLADGADRSQLPYVNFEEERLAGLTAEHLHPLVEHYHRRHPEARARKTVTWCFDEIQVVPGAKSFALWRGPGPSIRGRSCGC